MALTIGDNFSYQGSKPLDSRLTYATIAEMKSKADSTLYDGIMAYCKANEKTYQWKSTNEVDATLGKWREFESGGGGEGDIQVETMPEAGEDYTGKIYQYIGESTAEYVNGYFYECIEDEENPGDYIWEQKKVQSNEDLTPSDVEDIKRNFTVIPYVEQPIPMTETEVQAVKDAFVIS